MTKHKFLIKHFFRIFLAFIIVIGFVSFFPQAFGLSGGSSTVSVTVPSGSSGGTVQVQVCGTDGAGNQVCGTSNSMTVNASVTPSATLLASPTSISSGSSSTLSWSSTNATSCTGTGPNFSTSGATSGSTSVNPTSTTTYTLNCSGAGGSAPTQTATVAVTASGPATATISVSPNPYIIGGPDSTLSWSCDSNAVPPPAVSGGDFFSSNLAGSASVHPTSSTTYSITCTENNGSQVTNTALLTVSSSNNSVTFVPASNSCFIQAGHSACGIGVNWNVSNEQDNYSNNEIESPQQFCNDKDCTTSGGTYSCDRYGNCAYGISVNNPGHATFYIPYGSQTFDLHYLYYIPPDPGYLYGQNFDEDLAGLALSASCTSGSSWNGLICAAGNNNNNNNNNNNPGNNGNTGPNGLSINASSSTITTGSPVNITWTSSDHSCSGSTNNSNPFNTGGAASGTVTENPTTTTTYTVTCSPDGSVSTTVTVNKKQPIYIEK